MTQTLLGN